MDLQNIEQVFTRIWQAKGNSMQQVLIHDELLSESILIQYYYMKAFKLVAPKEFSSFSYASVHSFHGAKMIFKNIISMYSDHPDSLQYCHELKDGLPRLSHYVTIATSILKD